MLLNNRSLTSNVLQKESIEMKVGTNVAPLLIPPEMALQLDPSLTLTNPNTPRKPIIGFTLPLSLAAAL